MDKIRILKTDEEMKVFSDPFRLQIISAFKNAEVPMTAKGISDRIGVVPSKVHYHVKKLLAVGILELDHIESINGIQAKFYKLTAEEFRLEVTDSMGDMELVANRTIKVFNAVVDDYKALMYKTTKVLTQEDFEPKGKGTFLRAEDIYLTDEQAEGFIEEMIALVEKYKKKTEEDQIPYRVLVGSVQDCDKDA